MTSRERVNAAVRRQPVDRVPCEMGFTPAIARLVQDKLGRNTDPAVHFGWDTRGVGFRGPRDPQDFAAYYHGVKGVYWDHDYGTGEVPGDFHHFARKVYPLRDVQSISGLEEYPWPDFTPAYRHSHLEGEVAYYQDQGYHVSGWVGHIWETTWQILGFERTFADLLLRPEIPLWVLNKICENNCFKARRYAEAGVDMLRIGDDVGMQDRLMMQPGLWRRYLKPVLAREIAAAREVRPDIPVWFHSDGNILAIIDDLIEVGVTVLNPVQPECLDFKLLARRYGEQLSFWGGIGTQTTMPWGSPADVKAAVKDTIETFAPGLVLAPTHVLEPEVPWENIVAFHEAIAEYGVFG
jgi:uroporphyrinogen decarboxylase